MQEKDSIMAVWCELKIPSLGITVRHHSASLMTPTVTPVMEFSIGTSQPLKSLILSIRQLNRVAQPTIIYIISKHN